MLNKAHVKFLENKFYNLASNSSRAKIVNSSIPTCSSIDEFDLAMLEEFIDNSKLLVNSLGYKVFDTIEENLKYNSTSKNIFYINAPRGASGIGAIVSDGFVVFKDTTIANQAVPSAPPSIIKLRTKLINDGVIDNNFKFVKDYIFTSPSLAAAVVTGRTANGRVDWKTKDHKTIKMQEENELI